MSDMSRSEAISILKKLKLDAEDYGKESDFVKQAVEAFDTAISSLETDEAYGLEYEQPEFCKDCISREAVYYYISSHINEIITESGTDKNAHTNAILRSLANGVKTMPSVLPKVTKNDLGVDWDELKRKILMEVDGGTDDAWLAYGEVCDRISNSIDEFVADMREVKA